MSRSLIGLCGLFAFTALAEDPPATTDSKPKLTVVPFAALSADIPPRIGAKASGMLSTEFKSSEKFELMEPKRAVADPYAEQLANARKSIEEAKELRAKRKFRLAEESLMRGLNWFRAVPGGITDIAEVVDGNALLAAVQYNTGRDDEGARSLNAALTLAPDRELPLAATSALFSKVVAEARKTLKDGTKGALLIESQPANAAIFVDGIQLGFAPVLVKDVPPGVHYWRAQLTNGEIVGGIADVLPGKQLQLKASPLDKDPQSRLMVAIAQNKIDADALVAAKEHAKNADAELVVFGALSKEGKGLALDVFMYAASSNEIRRLPRSTFDTELLSAGMEFFNLAGELAKKAAQTGEAVKVPATVAMSLIGQSPKTAEVQYGQQPGHDLSTEGIDDPQVAGPGKEGTKPPERRAPLKRK